ncbi:CDP-alcohol phosphatidyltransferase family protein [Flavobacteriales bacterium]|nr:CDP-alcohol phosphatidyltransferase family protein [Flavobacteriales bacterium]
MISIYKLKPKFQKLLMPLLKLLHNLGVTPNFLTVFTILFSFIIGYLLFLGIDNEIYFLFVSIGLLIRMMLNALDGMMATTYNLKSKEGEVLNEIGDILSDIAIYFPFIYFNSLSIELIIIFISLSVINEFCGLLAKSISGIRRYDGPMGKSDRAFFVGIICIILYFTNVVLVYLDYIFLFAIILMIISSCLRLTKSLKNE